MSKKLKTYNNVYKLLVKLHNFVNFNFEQWDILDFRAEMNKIILKNYNILMSQSSRRVR